MTEEKSNISKILSKQSENRLETNDEISDFKEKEMLRFLLSGIEYCIEADYVDSISEPLDITPVPTLPKFVLGVSNFKGRIIAMVDPKTLLNLITDYDYKNKRVIVINYKGIITGIPVDEINGITPIPENIIDPIPLTGESQQTGYLSGEIRLGETIISILNLENLISNNRVGLNSNDKNT